MEWLSALLCLRGSQASFNVKGKFMKRLMLVFSAAALLAGCARDHYYRGGTGTPTDVYQGEGSSVPVYRGSDLDDLGASTDYKNQRSDGQPRVPGHSVDINNRVP